MNTKPRAKKFRIRRNAPLVGDAEDDVAVEASRVAAAGGVMGARPAPRPAPPSAESGTARPRSEAGPPEGGAAAPGPRAPDFDPDTAFDNFDDGFGGEKFATARGADPAQNANIAEPQEVSTDEAIDAIRREGLTGRQLRMARRVAQKHGLAPTSDFDAVRLLRAKGIDPFERSTMLELVIADGKPTRQTGTDLVETQTKPNLPKTLGPPQLPSTKVMSEDARASEIYRIQRDIARRRRRKLAMLFVRLAIFVLLPTIVAGYYYYRIATPLYSTHSEFLIQKADSQASSLGGLFSGTQFATSQDSITVQSYLKSRDAMLRLDAEHGFKAHFSQESIDPIKRLPPGASNEEAYKLYQQYVKISFDPTEGIVKLDVIAADAKTSEEFAGALIHYAEEQVDHLSSRLRGDQMKGAQESYEDAERKMQAAQDRVLELQEELGVLDPTAESGALMGQISAFETEVRKKTLELQALMDNARPNQARVDGVKADIARLQALIDQLRAQLTEGRGTTASLARITGELRMAEVDLQTRQAMMAQALQQLETARIEANKQVRYLAVGVRPVGPDRPTYPRKFENTLLALLIFAGIYLMISLTASILREQVSS